METGFRKYISDNKEKYEFGLNNSKQNMIDSLIEIGENIQNGINYAMTPDALFGLATEMRTSKEIERLKSQYEEAKLEVLEHFKQKIPKTINNDKETSTKEKESK